MPSKQHATLNNEIFQPMDYDEDIILLDAQATSTFIKFIINIVKHFKVRFFIFQISVLGTVVEAAGWPLAIRMFTKEAENFFKNSPAPTILEGFKISIITAISVWMGNNILNRSKMLFNTFYIYPTLQQKLRKSILYNVFSKNNEFFNKNNPSEIVNRINLLSDKVIDVLAKGMQEIVPQMLTVVWLVSSFYFIHVYLGLIATFVLTVYFIILRIFVPRAVKLSTEHSEAYNIQTGKMADSVFNIPSVKSYARKWYEMKFLKPFIEMRTKAFIRMLLNTEKMNWSLCMSEWVISGAIFIGVVLNLFKQGQIGIADVSYSVYCIANLAYAVWALSNDYVDFLTNIGYGREVIESFYVNDKEPEKVASATDKITFSHGKIEFRDVSFSYIKNNKFIEHMNLIINPKEKIGLVGLSGAGKTTFAHLILKHLIYEKGSILIDDLDITNMPPEVVRENIAYVAQDSTLFSRTILENIRYGKPEASFEEVIEAAKKAHAHTFIKDMENGYHTIIEERGAGLSGGQRQRVVIARAILKDAPILILDEVTAALDRTTEKIIQNSINELVKDRTALFIAHRLETLVKMDRILIFDKGKIVEQGKHSDLVQDTESLYYKLWRSGQESGGILH